jgi:hypothetical protein
MGLRHPGYEDSRPLGFETYHEKTLAAQQEATRAMYQPREANQAAQQAGHR